MIGLLALLSYSVNARASDCLNSAAAVRQRYPQAWPSWSLRAQGHEGTKCWYGATRATANDHQDQALAWNKAKHACPKYYRLMLCHGRVPMHLLHSPIAFPLRTGGISSGIEARHRPRLIPTLGPTGDNREQTSA